MSRILTDHRAGGLNERVAIAVMDEPGAGGACHEYATQIEQADGFLKTNYVWFQNGPVTEAGPNGITNEALLAIVIDRLRGFQSGEFACRENAIALTKLEEAMHWLHHRTRQRIQRGIEGTSQK